MKVISIIAMNTLVLVAAGTSFTEASSLLTLVSFGFESSITVADATSISIEFGSAPAVDTFITGVSSTCATGWVTFEADITVGASACASGVTLFTFSFVVYVLVPVTVPQEDRREIEHNVPFKSVIVGG